MSEQFPIFTLDKMSYAYPEPSGRAVFKQQPEDFVVRETLSFEPDGEGNHACLYIEKTNTNTEWLARQLARFTGVEAREVGYAGLKDRQAVTSQWFTIKLEGVEKPDWDEFQLEGVKILTNTWHRKKLKRGSIKHNQFKITLRNIQESRAEDIEQRFEQIAQHGVPNYFGPQRFGHSYNNLHRAARWFNREIKIKKRNEKSMILSASRSMIFNQLLSQRIEHLGWDVLADGEVMMLDGTRSVFSVEHIDNEILQRFYTLDIHPTTAMWGRGRLSSSADILKLEQQTAEQSGQWCGALENQGLQQERRSVRLLPKNIQTDFNGADQLSATLSFTLPPGSYATAVLRELIEVS